MDVIKKKQKLVSAFYIRKDFQKSAALKKQVRQGCGKGIPLKKDRNGWERGALMVRIIAKEKK